MGFPAALSSGDKTLVRNTRQRQELYIIPNPNTNIMTARVNQSIFADTYASFNYDGASGDFNDVKVGMLLLLSTTSDRRDAYARLRIRAVPTSDTIYVDEISFTITDDDYIFIVEEYPIAPKYGRTDSSGVVYTDYNRSYDSLKPNISGLQSAYVSILTGANVSLALAPTGTAMEEGASISSWAWDVGTLTITVGSASTQNITVQATSTGVYWISVTVTDDNTVSHTFNFQWCVDSNANAISKPGFFGASINCSVESGWSATVSAFEDVSTLLDYTRVVIYTRDYYGAIASVDTSNIVTNINMIGYLRTEEISIDPTEEFYLVSEVGYRVEGFGEVAGRVTIPSWGFVNADTGTAFPDMVALTPSRGAWFVATELSTLGEICAIEFDEADSTYEYSNDNTDRGSISDAMNSLLSGINARLNYAASGEIAVYRWARYLATSDRSALTTVMDFTTDDYISIRIDRDTANLVGRVVGAGGMFLTASHSQFVALAFAPAVSQADAEGAEPFNGQVLTADSTQESAQNELAGRTSNHLAYLNPHDEFTVTLPGGYWWVTPSDFQWYTFTVAASDNVRGIAYTSSQRWLCTQISYTHDNETSTRSVSGTFAIETDSSDSKVAIELPVETPSVPPAPPGTPYNIPPSDPTLGYPTNNPSPEDVNPNTSGNNNSPGSGTQEDEDNPNPTPQESSGNVLLARNNASLSFTRNFWGSESPLVYLITPPSLLGNLKWFDVYGRAVVALSSDGTDSRVHVASNFYNPSWAYTDLEGVFDSVEYGGANTKIYTYAASNSQTWTHTFQFDTASGADPDTTYGNGSFVSDTAGLPGATYSAGVGWEDATSGLVRGVYIERTGITAFTVTNLELFFIANNATQSNHPNYRILVYDSLGVADDTTVTAVSNSASEQSASWDVSADDIIRIRLQIGLNVTDSPAAGDGTITKLVVQGTGANPFAATSKALSRYSTDTGSTFATAVILGDSPGSITGAFDASPTADIVIGGASNLTRNASAGGAYSDLDTITGQNAKLVHVFGSTTADRIVGYDAAVAGVTLTNGGSDITPNDGSNDGIVLDNASIDVALGDTDAIIGIASFGGTKKVMWSTNGGTSWTISGAFISSNGAGVAIKNTNTSLLFSGDGDSIWGSADAGSNWVKKRWAFSGIEQIRVK